MEELVDEYTKKEKDLQKPHEYRYTFYNWPTLSAPIYLQSAMRNFLDTKWMPDPYGLVHVPEEEAEVCNRFFTSTLFANALQNEVIEQRRLLREEIGWPDRF